MMKQLKLLRANNRASAVQSSAGRLLWQSLVKFADARRLTNGETIRHAIVFLTCVCHYGYEPPVVKSSFREWISSVQVLTCASSSHQLAASRIGAEAKARKCFLRRV